MHADHSRDAIEAMWARMRADHEWVELDLDDVPEDSLLAQELPALALADGHAVAVHGGSIVIYQRSPRGWLRYTRREVMRGMLARVRT